MASRIRTPSWLRAAGRRMPLRALLYRRPSEPQTIEVVFDQAIYPVRSAAIARRAATRCASTPPPAKSILTMPPRGSVREAKAVRAEARRLDRGAAASPAAGGAVRRRHDRCRCAASSIASCIGRARAARSGPKPARTASRCSASRARRRTSTAASAITCAARRGAISRPRAAAPPSSSASRSSASRCATSRAAGARARPPACCRIPGGSSSRRRSCWTISPCTRSRIWSR